MASIHNSEEVQNQAYNQTIHGNIVYHNSYSDSGKRRRYGDANNGLDPEKALDDDILASLAFPQMFDRRSNVETAHQRTCQWIFPLKEYQDWRANASGLLWIKGKPGAGKPTLMSHVYSAICCEPVVSRGILLEFFFSARGVELQHSICGMLRSLLNQILYHDRSIRDVVRKPYLKKKASLGSSKSNWQWQVPELKMLLSEALLISAKHQQLILLIDALDEAGEQAAREAVHYLHSINDRVIQATAKARICISSRHYPVSSITRATEIVVEQNKSDDIASYIRDHINIDEITCDPDEKTEWYSFVQELTTLAHGVFQWLRLVMPMIEKHIGDGDPPHKIREWLSQVPEELEQIYKHIITRVIDPKNRAMSFRLFQWISLAERPLLVTEMRYALAAFDIDIKSPQVRCEQTREFVKSDEAMPLRVKAWSGGLVEVVKMGEEDASVVQVIHQSVCDFLIKQGLEILSILNDRNHGSSPSNFTPLRVHEVISSCHAGLYWLCLNYLSTEASARSRDLSKFFGEHWSIVSIRGAVQVVELNLPLLEYSTSHMLSHAQKAQNHRNRGLEMEFRLLNSMIPLWTMSDVLYWQNDSEKSPRFRPGIKGLHIAAAAGLEDLTTHILAQNVDVDAVDEKGRTALHLAAWHGHIATTKLLVRAGADKDKIDKIDLTPLLLCLLKGHSMLFSCLLDQGANWDPLDPLTSKIFGYFVSEGNVAAVKFCINNGVDAKARGVFGHLPIQIASKAGDEEVLSLLLDAGADVNAQGGLCGSAIQVASMFGHKQTVCTLINAGADVNAEGGYFRISASETDDEAMVDILADANSINDTPHCLFKSALQAASAGGHEEVVRILIDAGADVNAPGGRYRNVFQAAAEAGHEKMMQLLVDAGVDVNADQGNFENALQIASSRGHEGVVRILLDAGAEIEAVYPSGLTDAVSNIEVSKT